MPKTKNSNKIKNVGRDEIEENAETLEKIPTKIKPLLDEDDEIVGGAIKDVETEVDPETLETEEGEESEDGAILDVDEIDPFGDKWEQ